MLDGTPYGIEPYHHAIHKRSLDANKGFDHIINRRESRSRIGGSDYVCTYLVRSSVSMVLYIIDNYSSNGVSTFCSKKCIFAVCKQLGLFLTSLSLIDMFC